MSHIVSFRIEGLAGRKEPLELKLNRDTNVFFGQNGSGKTSLLKILHAAMANETKHLRSVPFTAAKVSIYSRTWDKIFTRSIKKTKSDSLTHHKVRPEALHETADGIEIPAGFGEPPKDDEFVWDCTPSVPEEVSSSHWKHEYLPTARLHIGNQSFISYSTRLRSGSYRATEEQLDLFFADSVVRLWNQYSTHILKTVRTAQEQGLANILRAVLPSENTKQRQRKNQLTPETAYARVQNFLKRQNSGPILGTKAAFEKRYKTDVTLQDVVQDIDAVEDKIKMAMMSRTKLQKLLTRMFTKNKKLSFTDESIEVNTSLGKKIGLASLSSGEKHLLWIFVQYLLVKECSFIIDEPELSMHIDWQKDLIHSLRDLNSNTQLIFATHSPEIMADLPDDKIFRI